MVDRIADYVLQKPKITIITIVLITLFFAAFIPFLKMESDLRNFLPKGSASVIASEEIDRDFGGADQLFVAFEDNELFDHASLSKLHRLTEEIKEISGVSEVISITDLDEIRSIAGGIEVKNIVDKVPETEAELSRFRQKLMSDEKYRGNFVSEDGRATLVLVKLFVNRDKDCVKTIRNVARRYAGPERIIVAGGPYVTQVIQEGITKDIIRLIPLAAFLVCLVLFISFRSWYGVVLPLATVAISSICAIGMMGIFRQPLTVVSTAVPALLISIGSAYGIHVLARYREEGEGRIMSPQATLKKVISKTGVAIFIAAVTTVVGFASNLVSDISAIRVFGAVTGFGVIVAFVTALTFIPAVLQFIKPKEQVVREKWKDIDGPLDNLMVFMATNVTRRRIIGITVGLVLFIIAAIGYPRLTTESDPVKYFKEKSEIVTSMNLVRDKFGGATTLDILFTGDLKDPETLRKIDRLEQKLKTIKYVGRPNSIVDVLKETNRLMNGNLKKYEKVPATRQGVAQYLLLLSVSNSGFIDRLITPDQEKLVVSARVGTTVSTQVDKLVKEVERSIAEIFGPVPKVKIQLSGMAMVIKDMREMLIANQIQSLALAVGFIFLMVLLFYRTFWGSLACMAPIFFTIALNFGVMSWLKIPLDIATVMVGSISVGMGIDYSVHLFNRFKEEQWANKDPKESVYITLTTVGKAIIFNAASVAMGFIVVAFSEFQVLRNFGFLTALTMVFASFGALGILSELILFNPAMLREHIKRRIGG